MLMGPMAMASHSRLDKLGSGRIVARPGDAAIRSTNCGRPEINKANKNIRIRTTKDRGPESVELRRTGRQVARGRISCLRYRQVG